MMASALLFHLRCYGSRSVTCIVDNKCQGIRQVLFLHLECLSIWDFMGKVWQIAKIMNFSTSPLVTAFKVESFSCTNFISLNMLVWFSLFFLSFNVHGVWDQLCTREEVTNQQVGRAPFLTWKMGNIWIFAN